MKLLSPPAGAAPGAIGRAATLTLALAAAATGAQAGTWAPPRTLDGPMAVASPPEAPLVVADASGRTLAAWATAGALRWAEKRPGGTWTRAATVPGGAAIAGPLAVAAGPNGGAALAWTTVATRYTPSRLLVSLRAPGGRFAAPVEVGSFTAAGLLKLGIACSGEVTLVWQGPQGLASSRWAGDGGSGTGACDGSPGPGPWSAPAALAPTGAAWPELAVAHDGTALVAWQAGTAVQARRRDAGSWAPSATLSAPAADAVWGVQVSLDAQGRAAVGWLGGATVRLARGDVGGWQAPVELSAPGAAQGLALAGTAAGELLVAWQGLDGGGTGGQSGIWQRSAGADGLWSTATRLSAAGETPGAPSAAWAADGSVAVVAWVDDGSNQARAAVRAGAASWARSTLGVGWWGGTVPVAAGAGSAAAAWVIPTAGNPNAASVVARGWQ